MATQQQQVPLPSGALLIGDNRVVHTSEGVFHHVNPATGKVQGDVVIAGAEEVDASVRVASAAFPGWQALGPVGRRDALLRLAAAIRDHAEELAVITSLETGAPISLTRPGSARIADWFVYYAGWCDKLNGEVVASNPTTFDYTTPEPFGVIGAIVPWNAPTLVASMKASAALAGGNCVVVKPPELSPYGCLRLGELALEAGLPPGALNVVPGGAIAGEALVRHPGIGKLSFTGGTLVGRQVASAAGDVLKPVVMELGGKSANIVFPDADMETAVPTMIGMIGYLAGQGCALPTRMLIDETVYDEVLEKARIVLERMKVGDPLDPETVMGPMVSTYHRDRVEAVLREAVDTHAGRLVTGGHRLGGDLAAGSFLAPALLADVDPASSVAQEEIFGPVLVATKFRDEDEAIALANGTAYGLAGYVQTRDLERAHRVAARLQAGFIAVNTPPVATPATPFGGYKGSGWGREGGLEGAREFLRTKNVCLPIAGSSRAVSG